MNTPEPNDDQTALREALQRDAAGLSEPNFDAALHHATMRRIRALSEPGPIHHGWRLAYTGLLGAMAVVLMVRGGPAWHVAGPVPRGLGAQMAPGPGHGSLGHRASDVAVVARMGEPRERGAFFEPGTFGNERPMDAMLEAKPGLTLATAFPLDLPTGPIRLNCAYSFSVSDQSASFFGQFNFNVSN